MTTAPTEPQIDRIEVPVWAVPVWATIDGSMWQSDPLVEAVGALVEIGFKWDADIAGQLAMSRALVQAAADQLASQGGVVRDEDGRLSKAPPRPEDGDANRVATREAWVLWDPLHDRPLLQLWLDERYPGRDLRKPGLVTDHPARPRDRVVDRSLRLLAMVSGLQVLEPRGEHGAHLVDHARVRTIQQRGEGRPRRASAWVAVEHRLVGSVVWRPSAALVEDDLGELDPLGWEGLQTRLGARVAELDQARSAYQSQGVAPVLSAAGYDSVESLKEAARQECARELAGVGNSAAWSRTRQAIEEALSDQRLALAMDADWRRLARGWADAIEALTVEAVAQARHVISKTRHIPALAPETERQLQRLTGPSWRIVQRCSIKPSDFDKLRQKLQNDEESAGHRLAALAVAAVCDRAHRKALLRADAEIRTTYPKSEGLFPMLDRARDERNAISHVRKRAEDIDVSALRARVFALARALMGSGLAG